MLYGIIASQLTPVTPVDPLPLCPYVWDSQDVPGMGLNAYDSISNNDGVAVAEIEAASGSANAQAGAAPDIQRLLNPVSGESHWQSIPANNGLVGQELAITTLGDDLLSFSMSMIAGNAIDNSFAEGQAAYTSNEARFRLEGVGDALLQPTDEHHFPYSVVEGDRCGVTIDSDTGVVHLVNAVGHENFGGVPSIDVSGGCGFVASTYQGSSESIGNTLTIYTKASDMALPYPAGTKDACGNPVGRTLVTYPLDADSAEVTTAGGSGKLAMSLAEQRGVGTTVTPGAYESFLAFPAGFLTGTDTPIDVSSGPVAFELVLTVSNAQTSPTTGQVEFLAGAQIFDDVAATTSALFPVLEAVGNGDIGLTLTDFDAFSGPPPPNVVYTTNALPLQNVLGFVIEQGEAPRMWLNGVEVTLNSPLDWVGPTLRLMSIVEQTDTMNASNVGKTAGVRVITDPYWFTTPFPANATAIDGVTPAAPEILPENVKILMHFDEPFPSQVFTDQTGRQWNRLGSVQTSTDRAKFGDRSGKFIGFDTGLATEELVFADNDFTIEAWIYMNPGYDSEFRILMSQRDGFEDNHVFILNLAPPNGEIRFVYTTDGSTTQTISGAETSAGEWQHVAVERYNDQLTIYLNGVGNTPTDFTGVTLPNNIFNFYIGSSAEFDREFDGYIDEARVVIGQAVYKGNFTPPTAPFKNP